MFSQIPYSSSSPGTYVVRYFVSVVKLVDKIKEVLAKQQRKADRKRKIYFTSGEGTSPRKRMDRIR